MSTETKAAPMSIGHTPGPWAFSRETSDENRVGYAVGPNTRNRPWVAFITAAYEGGTNESNARLIAAAPDLLAAAQIGLACCIAWGGKCEAKGENILAMQSAMHAESIRAAIAKATP